MVFTIFIYVRVWRGGCWYTHAKGPEEVRGKLEGSCVLPSALMGLGLEASTL